MKFMCKFSIVWFLVKKHTEVPHNICLMTFSFHDTCHYQVTQAIRWSTHCWFTVTVGTQSSSLLFQGIWQCAAWHSAACALTCWHKLVTDAWSFTTNSSLVQEVPHKSSPSGVPAGKNPLKLVNATEDAMHFVLDVYSRICCVQLMLDIFSHNVPDIYCFETTTSASQLQVHLYVAMVEQFTRNHDITEH